MLVAGLSGFPEKGLACRLCLHSLGGMCVAMPSMCAHVRAPDANAACSTTPAMLFSLAAKSSVGPEPRLCPYRIMSCR